MGKLLIIIILSIGVIIISSGVRYIAYKETIKKHQRDLNKFKTLKEFIESERKKDE